MFRLFEAKHENNGESQKKTRKRGTMVCIPSNLVLLELGPLSKTRGALTQRGRQRLRPMRQTAMQGNQREGKGGYQVQFSQSQSGRKKKRKKKKEGQGYQARERERQGVNG